ncbi:MAG: glycosyltransferase family 4 protein [Candidatus Poribacteria bacterium]
MKISRAQRALGYKSDCAIAREYYFEFGSDYNLRLDKKGVIGKLLTRISAFVTFAFMYDVFHFHVKSILPGMLDIPLLRIFGKKIIFQYHGLELKGIFNSEEILLLKEKGYKGFRLLEARLSYNIVKRFSHAVLVSTPDLLTYAPHAIWIPQPTDLDYWNISDEKNNNVSPNIIKICHAPSIKSRKGTEYLVSAVEQLKSDGHNIELIIVNNIPYKEVKKYLEQADIFVDQLLVGWYGNASCEAMALMKPVCAYIRPDLIKYLDGCPIVNTDSENLIEMLKMLIENPSIRSDLGRLSREYVKNRHSLNEIAIHLIDIYKKF